jgi:hypothetical protein
MREPPWCFDGADNAFALDSESASAEFSFSTPSAPPLTYTFKLLGSLLGVCGRITGLSFRGVSAVLQPSKVYKVEDGKYPVYDCNGCHPARSFHGAEKHK